MRAPPHANPGSAGPAGQARQVGEIQCFGTSQRRRRAIRRVVTGQKPCVGFGGSTNLALAALLPAIGLTVVTNWIAIAYVLAGRGDLRLHVIGGMVDPNVGGCVDTDAVLALQRLNVDRCFLGACSASSSDGISAFDGADAAFKRVALACSRQVALMVTTDKLGTQAPYRVAPLDAINTLVVEHDAVGHPDFTSIASSGIDIVTAAQPS